MVKELNAGGLTSRGGSATVLVVEGGLVAGEGEYALFGYSQVFRNGSSRFAFVDLLFVGRECRGVIFIVWSLDC
jgi:hypothetical protein